MGACIHLERMKLQSERTVYSRKVWHNVLRTLVQRERHSQLTWKAIDINFMHDILIRDFIMVAILETDSESDMSSWGLAIRIQCGPPGQTKKELNLGNQQQSDL